MLSPAGNGSVTREVDSALLITTFLAANTGYRAPVHAAAPDVAPGLLGPPAVVGLVCPDGCFVASLFRDVVGMSSSRSRCLSAQA